MLQSICEIRAELESLSDPVYREFSSSLVPGSQDMLGVRRSFPEDSGSVLRLPGL